MKKSQEKIIETCFIWTVNSVLNICKQFAPIEEDVFFDFLEGKANQFCQEFSIEIPKIEAKTKDKNVIISFEFKTEKLFHYVEKSKFSFVKWKEI